MRRVRTERDLPALCVKSRRYAQLCAPRTAGFGEIRLIDALIRQLEGGMPVYGHEFEGVRLDTGNPDGYKEAIQTLC